MTAANHDVQLEDVMALLDGELPVGQAERVRAHLAVCAECQEVSMHMRGVSQRLAGWDVQSAPASLTFATKGLARRAYRRWLPIAAAVTLALSAVLWVGLNGPLPSRSARTAETPAEEMLLGGAELNAQARLTAARPLSMTDTATERAPGPQLARTARLGLVCTDVEATRTKIEGIVTGTGGYIERISASDDGRGVSVSATFRIPTDRLPQTLTAIKALGRVTLERQEGEDVAQQSTDLDARLSNARSSEERLRRILADRTGDVTQVLEVEGEIRRLRGEIERMEAEREALDTRIDYAILSLDLYEDRKAAVDLGPVPLSSRFRDAFVVGWMALLTAVIESALAVTQWLPTILAIGIVAIPIARFVRRRRV
jgi:hypothetical protein